MNENFTERKPKIFKLFWELKDDAQMLVRDEIALFKQEIKEKANLIKQNVNKVAIGSIVAAIGLFFVLGSIISLIAVALVRNGMDIGTAAWLVPLVSGLVILLVGGSVAARAVSRIAKEPKFPEKTYETLEEDKEWIQQKVS
jgi:hypothetical protein